MRAQSTLVRRVRLSGIGLHTGRHVRVVLHPARADHGVVFYRSDVDAFIPAVAEAAGCSDHATSLGGRGRDVATVEHLLSAAVGAGLDNLLVELDGPEVPILDGSALPWLDGFETAGLVALNARAVPFVPSRVLTVSESSGKKLEIRPARDLRFADEFVRHKALDLLGDLALVGRPVLGHVVAHKAGHAMHATLARLLREESRATFAVRAATPAHPEALTARI